MLQELKGEAKVRLTETPAAEKANSQGLTRLGGRR
jgi:hypothetical protein